MSIKQTFYLAHTARAKLAAEATRQDHDLRLLVGHANFLDALMVYLWEAERAQQLWFDDMVRGNEEPREIHDWSIMSTEEDDSSPATPSSSSTSSPSPSSSASITDNDDEMDAEYSYPLLLMPQPARCDNPDTGIFFDEEYEGEDGMYALMRTSSHRPPALCPDMSDDEEEDSNPPSPPQTSARIHLPLLVHKHSMQQATNATSSYYHDGQHQGSQIIPGEQFEPFFADGYFIPERSQTIVGSIA
ncbi:hypothetical protein RUND412_010490 [Rhizina undulata]